MRTGTVVAVIVASMLPLAGCGGGDSAPKLLDERHGMYEGVGIGSSSADVRARFGEPADSQGFVPLKPRDVKGPYAFSVPGRTRPSVMRYDRVAFILAHDRVFGLITSDRGAVLTRKVGVGDSLDELRKAYGFACREVRAGEAIIGQPPTYTVCHAELANGSQIVVTEDPVESITLLRVSAAR